MTLIIALIACGVLLILAEMVIPGGIVGIFGALMITGGVVLGFMESTALGLQLFAGSVVFGIVAFWAWVKYFPTSPLGKRMFLAQDAGEWRGFNEKNVELLGKRGKAHTMLRPSGTVIIESKRYDVVGEGPVIDKGALVEVVHVEGNRIVVAELEAEPEQETDSLATNPQDNPSDQETTNR